MCRALICAALALGFSSPALAHIEVTSPTSRHGSDTQKASPCGDNGGAPTKVYRYEPGATLTLRWEEYVNHSAHYRISFDRTGDDEFVDPSYADDLYNDPTVLYDGIEDKDGGAYSFEVELPDVNCEDCTLQLIQVMKDGSDGGFSGNYFACIDFAIDGDPLPNGGTGEDGGDGNDTTDDGDASSSEAGDEAATDDSGAGCSCATSDADPRAFGFGFALIVAAGYFRRRRTRARARST